MGSIVKEMNLLLGKQILSFKSLTSIKKGGKIVNRVVLHECLYFKP